MPSSVSVQSQRLIPWLVERHALSKDYMKSLEFISKKIRDFARASPEKLENVEVKPVQYFYALDVLNHLEQVDSTKDFFGRASASVRTWQDIVSRYEKEHLNIAEVSERLNDICFQIPKCKAAIADRQKLITDLKRKIAECTANQHSKESELERFCKRFDIKDEYARLQLLEKASTLPIILNEYVEGLKLLEPAVNFYTSFATYINPDCKNNHLCPTLRLLIKCGHVTVYEWRTGNPPSTVGESNDYLPKMIELEKKEIKMKEIDALAEEQEIDFADFDKVDETDLTEIDFGTDLLTGIDLIDLSKETTSKNGGGDSETSNEFSCQATGKASAVATGADARVLLDSTEGRNALINDLEELASFLIRIRENFIDFQAADFDLSETKAKKRAGGFNIDSIAPIYHQIMLDAPEEVRSKTLEDVNSMSAAVQKTFDVITDETITHLSLLRLQPGYLERLIGMMQDLRRQGNRSRAKVIELTAAVEQANEELNTLHSEMTDCLKERKQLVAFLEKELSKLYERDIKLIGAAISM